MAKRIINRKAIMANESVATGVSPKQARTASVKTVRKQAKRSSKRIDDAEYQAFQAWQAANKPQELPLPSFIQAQLDKGIIDNTTAQAMAQGYRLEQGAAADGIPAPTLAKPRVHVHAPAAMVKSEKNKNGKSYENMSLPYLFQPATGNDYNDRFIIGYRKLKAVVMSLDKVQEYLDYIESQQQ